jgi:hypothetical protein
MIDASFGFFAVRQNNTINNATTQSGSIRNSTNQLVYEYLGNGEIQHHIAV